MTEYLVTASVDGIEIVSRVVVSTDEAAALNMGRKLLEDVVEIAMQPFGGKIKWSAIALPPGTANGWYAALERVTE